MSGQELVYKYIYLIELESAVSPCRLDHIQGNVSASKQLITLETTYVPYSTNNRERSLRFGIYFNVYKLTKNILFNQLLQADWPDQLIAS